MSPIPQHCPFAAGDPVVKHGWPGEFPKPDPWTGTVVGYGGGTLLAIDTDDGRQIFEEWGQVWPHDHDIAAASDGYRCVCHFRPPVPDPTCPGRFLVPQSDYGPGGIYGPPVAAVQLGLFAAGASS